jgi:hypothetical protein
MAAENDPPETPVARGAPPLGRQKSFIVENAGILDSETKKAMLRLVMMEIGRMAPGGGEGLGGEPAPRPVVLEQGATKEVSIDLDNIDNPEVILQLYNIVNNRRASLNEPARDSAKI